MSKIRNRNVKISLQSDLANFQPIPSSNVYSKSSIVPRRNEEYFGENIPLSSDCKELVKEASLNSMSSNNDNENMKLDFKQINRDNISSSSSLSWSDEYESDASKKVQEELMRIDKMLHGTEAIPPQYDKEEFQEWMEFFPGFSIFGNKDHEPDPNTPNIIHNESGDGLRNNRNTQRDCDANITSRKVSEAVIKKIYENVSSRLLNQRANEPHRKATRMNSSQKKNFIFSMHKPSKSVDTDAYLRISPIKHKKNERKQSSKSLLEQHLNTSREHSPEFISLPFLPEETVNRNSFFARSHAKKSKLNVNGRKINTLVLPPIENTNIFRSISATPRNKLMSNQNHDVENSLTKVLFNDKSKRFLI